MTQQTLTRKHKYKSSVSSNNETSSESRLLYLFIECRQFPMQTTLHELYAFVFMLLLDHSIVFKDQPYTPAAS